MSRMLQIGPASPGLAWHLCCHCQLAGDVLLKRKTFPTDYCMWDRIRKVDGCFDAEQKGIKHAKT